MAEPNNPLHILEEQVKCPICLEVYDQPKSLRCQHAFCKDCIKSIPPERKGGKRVIRCPSCRRSTTYPKDGPDSLPPSFHVNTLVELYRRNTENKDLPPRKSDASTKCPQHCDRLLEMYCERCGVLVCAKCVVCDHRHHDYHLLSDIFPQHKQEIETHLHTIQHITSTLTNAIDTITTRETDIRDSGNRIKTEIDSLVGKILESLQRSSDSLKEKIEGIVEYKLKELIAQREKGERILSHVKTVQDQIENQLKTGTEQKILTEKDQSIERMTAIIEQVNMSELQPSVLPDMTFAPNNHLLSEFNDVTIGNIHCPTYYEDDDEGAPSEPSHEPRPLEQATPLITCSGKGLTVAVVGKSRQFDIQLPSRPEGPLSCILSSKGCPDISCTATEIRAFYEDESATPKYVMTYTPTHQGVYNVEMTGVTAMPIESAVVRVLPTLKTRYHKAKRISGLRGPQGVATYGNILVVTTAEGVTVMNREGEVVRVFAGQGCGEGQLLCPAGVAIDSDATILVADHGNDRVQQFTMDGTLLACIGDRGDGILEFDRPSDVSVDRQGHIYISDTGNNRIQVLKPNLTFSHTLGDFGSGSGELWSPTGISLDSQGFVYVCDTYNSRVQKFTREGEYVTQFGQDILRQPCYLTIDTSDMVYVTDVKTKQIVMFENDGEHFDSYCSEDPLDQFVSPQGLTVDSEGTLYVCDGDNIVVF